MDVIIKQILEDLEKRQTPHRYRHTVSVMYTAAALCMNYHVDVYKGMLAGALHDCGKLIEIKDYISQCQMYQIAISDDEMKAPQLLHAHLGAYFARERYFISDDEVLHAIKVHTTGSPNMNLLDKIIFVADYIEPHRVTSSRLDELRELAFKDLDKCILLIIEETLDYLKRKNYYVGKATIETYNYYKKGENYE